MKWVWCMLAIWRVVCSREPYVNHDLQASATDCSMLPLGVDDALSPESKLDGARGRWIATDEEMEFLQTPFVAEIPLVRHRIPGRRVGNATLVKSVFYGHVQVGDEVFSVVFDSGSGHLILPGEGCVDKACLRHRRYAEGASGIGINADGSRVFENESREQLTVNFGTGEVTGVFAKDIICPTGNASAAELCAESRIIVASKMSDNPFAEFAFDGVFGLGLPGLSQAVEFNMATQLLASLPSGRRVFSFFFSHAAEGSSITFGGVSAERISGPVAWVPVLEPEDGYWKIAADGLEIGGEGVSICANGCNAVADTGTSVFAGPSSVIEEIRSRFGDIATKQGSCQLLAGAEDASLVSVSVGGLDLVLAAKDISQPLVPFGVTEIVDGTPCELTLMRLDVPPPLGPLIVLGEPFLTKYAAVFDVEHLRVGFAPAQHGVHPSPTYAEL